MQEGDRMSKNVKQLILFYIPWIQLTRSLQKILGEGDILNII